METSVKSSARLTEQDLSNLFEKTISVYSSMFDSSEIRKSRKSHQQKWNHTTEDPEVYRYYSESASRDYALSVIDDYVGSASDTRIIKSQYCRTLLECQARGFGRGNFGADYGGAVGLYSIGMIALGMEVDLYDANSFALQIALETAVKMFSSVSMTTVSCKANTELIREYDCVVAMDVFEHLHDPVWQLLETHSKLKVGGVLFDGTHFGNTDRHKEHIAADDSRAIQFNEVQGAMFTRADRRWNCPKVLVKVA